MESQFLEAKDIANLPAGRWASTWSKCRGGACRDSAAGRGHESTTFKREMRHREPSILSLPPHPLAILAVTREEGVPSYSERRDERAKNLQAHNRFMCLPGTSLTRRRLFLFINLTRSVQG